MKSRTAERGWRAELDSNPKLKELRLRLAARKRALRNDKEFAIETVKLFAKLERALAEYPNELSAFFRGFSYPVGMRLPELSQFLRSVKNATLRQLFEKYVSYVARFGVVVRLRKSDPHFDLEYLVPFGQMLHVRLAKGHFEPGSRHPGGNTPNEYFFEPRKSPISLNLRDKLDSAKAKVVVIDDSNWKSVLTKVEYLAYDPERLTFIIHNVEQQYLLCLVGEKATNKQWGKASTVVSAFLRESFNRGKAGRRRNLPRFRQMIRLRNAPGPIKGKLSEFDRHLSSEQTYSARVAKSVRDSE